MAGQPDQRASERGLTVICLTGAESSGKTTLARDLADALQAELVPEQARAYLNDRSGYSLDDVLLIAHAQASAEAHAVQRGRQVVADTDLLVIRVWLEERFGGWPAELERRRSQPPPKCYLLTMPDIDWEADPQRENPHDRERLHERYRAHLTSLGAPWLEVGGSPELRLRNSLNWLRSNQLLEAGEG